MSGEAEQSTASIVRALVAEWRPNQRFPRIAIDRDGAFAPYFRTTNAGGP
jgi:hypothetical protein